MAGFSALGRKSCLTAQIWARWSWRTLDLTFCWRASQEFQQWSRISLNSTASGKAALDAERYTHIGAINERIEVQVGSEASVLEERESSKTIFTGDLVITRNSAASHVLALLLLIAAVTDAHSQSQISKTQPRAANAGQRAFAARCASCHGLDGRGGERGP